MTWFQLTPLSLAFALSDLFMGTFTKFGTIKCHYGKIFEQLSLTLRRNNLTILLMKNTVNYLRNISETSSGRKSKWTIQLPEFMCKLLLKYNHLSYNNEQTQSSFNNYEQIMVLLLSIFTTWAEKTMSEEWVRASLIYKKNKKKFFIKLKRVTKWSQRV